MALTGGRRMSRNEILLQYPKLDHTESIANIELDVFRIDSEKGITIKDAFFNKNNSLFLHILNFGNKSSLTVKAGNAYPNSMLGDIVIEIPEGISAICIQDLARFEKDDGSLDLDFADDFDGAIYAIARWKYD